LDHDTLFSRLVGAAEQATRRATANAGDASGWDEAVTAWEAALGVMAQVKVPVELQTVLLDRAAGAWLRRSQYGAPVAAADAAAAADLYGHAAELAAGDSPDRRAYLNNLGVALRTLWQYKHAPDILDKAITALEAAVIASARDTPDGITSRLQLGTTLRERYRQLHRPRDLEKAVKNLSEAVARSALIGVNEQAECHEALGNALYDCHAVTGVPATLDDSIENLRAALELIPRGDADSTSYETNLGSALLSRFDAGGNRGDLTEAVRLFEDAVKQSTDEPSAELLANLGNALGIRSVVDASREDADHAVAHLQRAVEVAVGTSSLPGILSNLSAALLERFDLTGQIADIDDAVEMLDRAVATSASNDPERSSRLNNLAIGLRVRHLRRRRGREDLDRAIAAYKEALAATAAGNPDRPAYQANLGNALHQRFDVTGDPKDLGQALQEFERALAGAPEDSPDRPMYLNNLSATLSARAERLGTLEDLRRAAGLLHTGLALCPESSVRRVGILTNLGNATSELFDRLGDPSDRADAERAYRTASRDELGTSPTDALAAARNWSEWAARRGAWSEVVEAYAFGERAAERLFRTQLVRTHKESWLRDADGLAAAGALAHAAGGDPAAAALALECGRARLYAERLEREHADLRRLQAVHNDLALRYRAAAARVGRLEDRYEHSG
jgi:hypothetical protein